jgi:hypothetical protein
LVELVVLVGQTDCSCVETWNAGMPAPLPLPLRGEGRGEGGLNRQ